MTNSNSFLEIPRKNLGNLLATTLGIKAKYFQNMELNEIMDTLTDNWIMCNNLVFALYEIAGRRRLAVLISTLEITHPIKFQAFHHFSNNLELIEQWQSLYREIIKKWGTPFSTNELSAAIFKNKLTMKNVTPYQNGVLSTFPRLYSLGRVLLIKLDEAFCSNKILKTEFFKHMKSSPENSSMANLNLSQLSFPDTLKEAQVELGDEINCFEDLD
jgi:hypothetical protein